MMEDEGEIKENASGVRRIGRKGTTKELGEKKKREGNWRKGKRKEGDDEEMRRAREGEGARVHFGGGAGGESKGVGRLGEERVNVGRQWQGSRCVRHQLLLRWMTGEVEGSGGWKGLEGNAGQRKERKAIERTGRVRGGRGMTVRKRDACGYDIGERERRKRWKAGKAIEVEEV